MKKKNIKKNNYTRLFIKTVVAFIGAETTIAMITFGLIEKLF